MASTSKAFRRCVHPCPCYLTPDDTHDLCVFCLGEEHARDVLEGAICVHCEFFSMRKLRSRLSLFSRKEGQPSASRGSGPTVAEARRGMFSWGSQAELADELERGLSLSRSSARERGWAAGWWWRDFADIIWSSGWCSAGFIPGRAGDVWGRRSWGWARSILLPCVWRVTGGYGSATARLDLPWKRAKMVAPRGRLDERYLSGHSPPARVSLPFLPDLHAEVEREWKKPFSACIHSFSIPVMLTWRGCVKTLWEDAPCGRDAWPAISPWARHPLLRLPPCHLRPFRKHLA